jgi:hypothetical protein
MGFDGETFAAALVLRIGTAVRDSSGCDGRKPAAAGLLAASLSARGRR